MLQPPLLVDRRWMAFDHQGFDAFVPGYSTGNIPSTPGNIPAHRRSETDTHAHTSHYATGVR